jgi:hypothetical protein
MMTYAQQIKDPRWQKKRLEVLELQGFKCQECDATDQELHVHHPFYKRGAMIWEYDTGEELMCLCQKCHKNAHAIDEELKKSLSILSYNHKLRILGYVDGFQRPPRVGSQESYMDGYADNVRGDAGMLSHLVKTLI